MIDRKKVLAIIPARGGSKGLPRKNIRQLEGKPLLAWTIDEAKKSKCIDRLILSSEDQEIISIAKECGCEVPFVRPNELAQDDTAGVDTVLHAVKMLSGYNYVVLLQPTSPLRLVEDIDACIEKCLLQDVKACVSVVEAEKSPYWMYCLNDKSELQRLIRTEAQHTRRQDLPRVYAVNGAVYCIEVEWLLDKKSFITDKTVAHIMPKERSVDIDSEIDALTCELLLQLRNKTGE